MGGKIPLIRLEGRREGHEGVGGSIQGACKPQGHILGAISIPAKAFFAYVLHEIGEQQRKSYYFRMPLWKKWAAMAVERLHR